jgi:uncharacterized membrane protein
VPGQQRAGNPSPAVEENVRAIDAWERTALNQRSRAEQVGDWITATAASGPVLLLHVLWFACWAAVNTGVLPGVRAFDPFPFSLLTMIVSLEAIFLALFVLASQNRLSHQADKRANLDLQINLLAEQEMTLVLQLLQGIAAKLDVKPAISTDLLRELAKETDISALTQKLDRTQGPETPCESRTPVREQSE